MNEQDFQTKLGELMGEISTLPPAERRKLEQLANETRVRHERLRQSVGNLQESLDYLRLSIKYLVFDLEAGGKRVSRNLIFFDVTHNLELPVMPSIETNLSQAGGGYAITLQSSKLARGVYISFGDLDVESADNYFDLLPGEPVTIALKSSATIDQLKSALKVMSLTEAYSAN